MTSVWVWVVFVLIFALVRLSAAEYVVYVRFTAIDDSLSLNPNWCHYPLITQLSQNSKISYMWCDNRTRNLIKGYQNKTEPSTKLSVFGTLDQHQQKTTTSQTTSNPSECHIEKFLRKIKKIKYSPCDLPWKKVLVRRKATASLSMDNLSNFDKMFCSNGSREAKWSNSPFNRSLWRFEGLLLAWFVVSFTAGVGLKL